MCLTLPQIGSGKDEQAEFYLACNKCDNCSISYYFSPRSPLKSMLKKDSNEDDKAKNNSEMQSSNL